MMIDSDILIDESRNQSAAIEFLIHSNNSETLNISVISYLELQAGARNKAELQRIEKFLSRFVMIPLDSDISHRAISLMQQYRLSHGLALPDALIAATALEEGETLATYNLRDFSFMIGLRIVSPNSPS
ncbi:MAG: type II toxin-antitoxin system VapC family toxin [Anaerolineae bacterium]|nr:type II toxin-antitoxin system VapC family toxin [Anaerolineae bacterium]